MLPGTLRTTYKHTISLYCSLSSLLLEWWIEIWLCKTLCETELHYYLSKKLFYMDSLLCLQLRFWQVNWVKKIQILRCAPKISRQISTHETLVTCQNQQKAFVGVRQSKNCEKKKFNTRNSTPSHHKNTHGNFFSLVLLLYFAIFIIILISDF